MDTAKAAERGETSRKAAVLMNMADDVKTKQRCCPGLG